MHFILEELLGALNGIPERFRRGIIKEEAGASVPGLVVILDDLVQAAGGAGDRECSVFQTVHRRKAAWFVVRRD